MSVIYIFLEMVAIIIFLMLKKTNKKENILLWITLSLIILMCFNIFITFIFNTIKIKSSLTNLSIALILIILLMTYCLYKNKKIQQYYIRHQDIIVSIIILILVITIAYIQFGFSFDIYYSVTDASNHYSAAINFYNASDLLNGKNSSDIYSINNFATFMTGSYVNLGILLKSLSSFLNNTEQFVSISILFELGILYISGILMYFLFTQKNKKKYIVAAVFSIIYMLGYQLNSELSGFSYLSLGMVIIISIIVMIQYYFKNPSNNIIILMLFLLNLGLFFTYYFFVPIVYGAIFINILIRKNKERFDVQKVIGILYILLLPFLCGIYYFYLKEFAKGKVGPGMEAIVTEGDIYSNAISNFILFIPLIIICIYKQLKNKRNNFNIILLVFSILFTIILKIGNVFNYVSSYYLYKSYYVLWLLIIIMSFEGSIILAKNNVKTKKIVYLYIIIYITALIITVSKSNNYLNLFDIYYENYSIINAKNKDEYSIKNEYLKIIDYYNENLIDKQEKIYIIGTENVLVNRWLYQLYRNPYFIFSLMFETNSQFKIEEWLDKKIEQEYLIYSKKDFNYEPNENDENYEILYNNTTGAILRRKK